MVGVLLFDFVVEVNGIKLLVVDVVGIEFKVLCGMVDDLKMKIGLGVIVFGVVNGDKVSLIVGVIKDLIGKVKVGEFVNYMVV